MKRLDYQEIWDEVYRNVFREDLNRAIAVLEKILKKSRNRYQVKKALYKKIDLLFKMERFEESEREIKKFKRRFKRSEYSKFMNERMKYIKSL